MKEWIKPCSRKGCWGTLYRTHTYLQGNTLVTVYQCEVCNETLEVDKDVE